MSSNTKKIHGFDTVYSEDKLLVRNSQEVMFDSFKMSLNLLVLQMLRWRRKYIRSKIIRTSKQSGFQIWAYISIWSLSSI